MPSDALVHLHGLRMGMAILTIDASADKHRMGRDVKQRCRMGRVLGSVVRGRENMGFERAAEELVDGLPAWILGITGNEVREAARATAGQLQDKATIVRAIHVLDMRREELEVELVGKAGELAV